MGWFDGWFAPTCPVPPDERRWLDRRWAWLREAFGGEVPWSVEVVLPTPAAFPDPYDATPDAAGLMFQRVCTYMGVERSTVDLGFYGDEDERDPTTRADGIVRRSSGAAGVYHASSYGKRSRIQLARSGLQDPLALVATMAHELGHALLIGGGKLSADEPDHEPLTDLLTVYLGMGVFTANSRIRERNWTSGSVMGWSVGRLGYLSQEQFGYALALLARDRGETKPKWAKHLATDVRAAFRQALRWLRSPAATAADEPNGPTGPARARSRLSDDDFEDADEDGADPPAWRSRLAEDDAEDAPPAVPGARILLGPDDDAPRERRSLSLGQVFSGLLLLVVGSLVVSVLVSAAGRRLHVVNATPRPAQVRIVWRSGEVEEHTVPANTHEALKVGERAFEVTVTHAYGASRYEVDTRTGLKGHLGPRPPCYVLNVAGAGALLVEDAEHVPVVRSRTEAYTPAHSVSLSHEDGITSYEGVHYVFRDWERESADVGHKFTRRRLWCPLGTPREVLAQLPDDTPVGQVLGFLERRLTLAPDDADTLALYEAVAQDKNRASRARAFLTDINRAPAGPR